MTGARPAPSVAQGLALLRRVTSSGTGLTAATQLVTLGSTALSSVVLARSLGADGRGDVAAVMTTLTVLGWVAFLGVPHAAGYLSTRGHDPVVTMAAATTLGLGVAVGAVVWTFAPAFVAGHGPGTLLGLRVAAVLLPLVGVGLCGLEVVYAEGRVVLWNALRSLPALGPSLAILVLAAVDRISLGTVLGAYLGAAGLTAVLEAVVLVPRCARRPGWSSRRAIWAYSLPRWTSASSDAVSARLDQLMMVVFSTPAELGRYAVVVTAVTVANPLSTAIGMMAYPAARNAGGSVAAHQLWVTARRRALVLSLLTGTLLAAVGPWLVPLLFGPDFRGLGPVLALLVLAQVLNDRWVVDVLHFGGIGRPGLTVVASWAAAGVTAVGLVALGLDGLSPLEAAAMTLVGNAVRAALLHRRVAREAPADLVPEPAAADR